ncbi:ATP-dependent translocase ABCB1-like isoform X2 [Clavelina lepadiformis]|uniref:ATP-dependent translocase ABCB1-like isoform X2 n=1 Tax=Clavelina lepadiformis TaxID=159417 RepID=UPI00404179EE
MAITKVENSPLLEKKQDEEEKHKHPPPIRFLQLFRYATTLDYFYIGLGSLAAAGYGITSPALFLFFGQGINVFTTFGRYKACGLNYETCRYENYTTMTKTQWNDQIMPVIVSFGNSSMVSIYAFIITGSIALVTASLQMFFWNISSTRQVKMIQIMYFRAFLRQDVGFHDLNFSGELNSRLSRYDIIYTIIYIRRDHSWCENYLFVKKAFADFVENYLKIQVFFSDTVTLRKAIGDKLSLVIAYFAMGVASIVVALVYAWKVALVALAMTVFMMIPVGVLYKINDICKKRETDAYSKAGAIAEETISSVKTVASFGCQMKEVERYDHNLKEAKKAAMFRGGAFGVCMGLMFFTMYCQNALSFWYGTTLVLHGEIEAGDMLMAVFNVLFAGWCIGTLSTNISSIPQARAVAARIYQVIDRVPEIDIFSNEGDHPSHDDVTIKFSDVNFKYPTREDVKVIKDMSFTIEHGQRVGLVGQSGCGKSTIVQLIQRFYDVKDGSVHIGGKNVKNLNLKMLRDLIGVVSQEPVLFGTSIAENIRWGRTGISDEELHEAAKKANAFNFIMKLPEKFDTLVGEAGSQLSGGQKQRIAIARAIARNPKILLLDEATSSLDTHSEAKVQAALDRASEGRTTVVVAHRLSTIRDCDKIIALHDGSIMEQGNHEELMSNPGGVYHTLVMMKSVDHCATGEVDEEKFPALVLGSPTKKLSPIKSSLQKDLKHVEVKDEEDDDDDEEEEEEVDLPKFDFTRFLKMNAPEWLYVISGCFFSVLAGAPDPLSALIIAEFFKVFTYTDVQEALQRASFLGGMFVVLGAGALLSNILENLCFAKSGMELTMRLRKGVFKSILHQDISFFDERGHGTGTLCHRLAVDASRVQNCTGETIGIVMKNISTLVVALGLSFAYGWKVTLVVIPFLPFMVLGTFVQIKFESGEDEQSTAEENEAGALATEAIMNIRTVASLTKEHELVDMYTTKIKGSSKVLIAVMFGAIGIGANTAFAADFAKATLSAARMIAILDRIPFIDASSTKGTKPDHCKGEIFIKSVSFRYPNRPDALVLEGINVRVKPGQTLALVGQSGCGKTTIIKLISRFYDVDGGGVYLDETDIRDLNVAWLRQQIGVVSQEPVLLNQTIKENIQYGDCTREISDEEIEEAAEKANAANFISGLPDGYDTPVGAKGGKLSGGQKQRVAISRALVRNPKVLLLDEATSALDTESEKMVQEALDAAREGRTSIVIAHRLSTVKNADQIAVIDHGRVVELGTHESLIVKRGLYYKLVNAQFMPSL